MAIELPETVRAAITAGKLAHLVTLNPDGSPHVTIVWVGLEGDDVVSGHMRAWQKVRNVERDPRVALSIEVDGKNEMGLSQYLVLNGRARVRTGGAADLLQRLAKVYLGPGIRFPPGEDLPPGYVLHIEVEKIGGVGPWQA
jgi:PPOX class probable F420-dependent enzyme